MAGSSVRPAGAASLPACSPSDRGRASTDQVRTSSERWPTRTPGCRAPGGRRPGLTTRSGAPTRARFSPTALPSSRTRRGGARRARGATNRCRGTTDAGHRRSGVLPPCPDPCRARICASLMHFTPSERMKGGLPHDSGHSPFCQARLDNHSRRGSRPAHSQSSRSVAFTKRTWALTRGTKKILSG